MLVQFGDNWIQKTPLTAKLRLCPIWPSSDFFLIQLFSNWTACSPMTYINSSYLVRLSALPNFKDFFTIRQLCHI